MTQKSLSAYFCAAVFVALTCVKLIFPSAAHKAASVVMNLIDGEGSAGKNARLCSEIISASDESITALLSGDSEAAENASGREQTYPAGESACRTNIIMPQNYYNMRSIAQREISREAAEAAALAEQRQAAVEAFKESQAEYASIGLPDTVSYEYYDLGIKHASPIPGMSSSGFGYRLHPIQGVVKFHYGTDFAANHSDAIAAFADGTVRLATECDSYGKYIIIEHDNGCETLYAHCSELLVSTGDKVCCGQTIAQVGSTGLATGPHLHFELKLNGTYLNPEYYTTADEIL